MGGGTGWSNGVGGGILRIHGRLAGMRLSFPADETPREIAPWKGWLFFVCPWLILTIAVMVLTWELTGGAMHYPWVWNQDTHSPAASAIVFGGCVLGGGGLLVQFAYRRDWMRRGFLIMIALMALLWSVRLAGPVPGMWLAWGAQVIVGVIVAGLFAKDEKLIG